MFAKIKLPEWLWLVFFARQMTASRSALAAVTLLTLVITLCGAVSPVLIGRIVDRATAGRSEDFVLSTVLLLCALVLTEVFSAVRQYVSKRTTIRLTYELTERTLNAVLNTSASFFTKTARGEMLQRCMQDTRVIQQFGLFTLPQLVQETLLACSAALVIGGIYWPIVVITAAAYVILFVPVQLFARRRGEARRQLVRQEAGLRQGLLERLESVKQIKLYGTERHEYEAFRAGQAVWADLHYKEKIVLDIYKGFSRMPDALAPALVFLFVGWQYVVGRVSLGELMTVIAFVPAFNTPIRSFFALYVTLTDIRFRTEGIMAYLKLPAEPGKAAGLRRPEHFRGKPLSFRGVSVDGEHGPLLSEVSFTINPGEHVAIVGPSGAGKSTLLKLIARLEEPSSGEIRFGGVPLRDLDAGHLRSRIGYMTQENVLFSGTLRDNLALFGQVDQTLIDGWMKALGADDIVAILPYGYDTALGDRGGTLSGGQRQLFGLVRTMLKQPDILLLDEATSALDEHSESIVFRALEQRMSGVTRISVTHRLDGARLADRILVLDGGRIVEEGTHDRLLGQPGLYSRLWHSEQRGKDDSELEVAVTRAGT